MLYVGELSLIQPFILHPLGPSLTISVPRHNLLFCFVFSELVF